MSDYSQPEFYSFSQDSIELAKYVTHKTMSMNLQSLLDLGCGCGVVGIEILIRREVGIVLDAIDCEKEWSDFFLKNCHSMIPQHKFQFHHKSFHDFLPERKYDCIVSNPPYFTTGTGRSNPNPLTDKARRWSEKEQIEFLKLFQLLKPDGVGFFLSRESLKHWKDLVEGHLLMLKLFEDSQVAGAKIITVTSFE